jgi:hypothetical protein
MKKLGSGSCKGQYGDPIEGLHLCIASADVSGNHGHQRRPILDQAFDAAPMFKPMSEQQVSALLAKTAQAAQNGRYELFKTTAHFDSTSKHRQWLGGDSHRTQELTQP